MHTFGAIKYALDGTGNGVQWMIDHRSFNLLLLLAESQIDTLGRELQRDRSVQVEAAKTQLASDLEVIEQGAEKARELSTKTNDVVQAAQLANEAIDATNAKKLALEKELENTSEKLSQFFTAVEKDNKDSRESLLKDIAQTKSKVEQKFLDLSTVTKEKQDAVNAEVASLEAQVSAAKGLSIEISSFHSKALTASSDALAAKEAAQSDLASAKLVLVESEQKQEAAKLALNAALQNVRRQGLSGAFFEKVDEVTVQRNAEQKRFQMALTYLAAVGILGLILELNQGLPQTFDQWLIRLIRLLLLAVPGVWIAWLAAKRLEALNRILSDYEYKSATALAFESYRQEIDTSGNADLKEELLRRAVVTFGENPTRFYDSSKDVSVMPVESMLDRLKGLVPTAKPTADKPVVKPENT